MNRYDTSPYGFLHPKLPIQLPESLEEYELLINNISNQDGNYFRTLVDNLNFKTNTVEYYENIVKSLSHEEVKSIYRTFSFICQKYIWGIGNDNQVNMLPKNIGVIWYTASKILGIETSCSYSSLILYNCILDPKFDWFDTIEKESYSVDEIIDILKHLQPVHNFTGSEDEANFYVVHMFIELLGGKFLHELNRIDWGNPKTVTINQIEEFFETIIKMLSKLQTTLLTLRKICTPFEFFNKIRIYHAGFNSEDNFPNGMKIEGLEVILKGRGGSGGQSSLFQILDILFGVSHENSHVYDIILDFRNFMPEFNRKLILNYESSGNKIINLVNLWKDQPEHDKLKLSFNKCVEKLAEFRQLHISIVHMYVGKFIDKIQRQVEEQNNSISEYITPNIKQSEYLEQDLQELVEDTLEKMLYMTKINKVNHDNYYNDDIQDIQETDNDTVILDKEFGKFKKNTKKIELYKFIDNNETKIIVALLAVFGILFKLVKII